MRLSGFRRPGAEAAAALPHHFKTAFVGRTYASRPYLSSAKAAWSPIKKFGALCTIDRAKPHPMEVTRRIGKEERRVSEPSRFHSNLSPRRRDSGAVHHRRVAPPTSVITRATAVAKDRRAGQRRAIIEAGCRHHAEPRVAADPRTAAPFDFSSCTPARVAERYR